MENKIVIKSLMKQLEQVIVHNKMENGATISNNLSEN
jgi:hypothetical protein